MFIILVMREIHIKAIRMAKIYGKRTINSGENVGSGHPSCVDSGGCKLVQSLCKSMWQFLKNLAVPFLGIYPKDSVSYYRDTCSCLVILCYSKQLGCGDRLDAHRQMMYAEHVLPRNSVILFICEESWNHEVCRWMGDHTMALRSHQSKQ